MLEQFSKCDLILRISDATDVIHPFLSRVTTFILSVHRFTFESFGSVHGTFDSRLCCRIVQGHGIYLGKHNLITLSDPSWIGLVQKISSKTSSIS